MRHAHWARCLGEHGTVLWPSFPPEIRSSLLGLSGPLPLSAQLSLTFFPVTAATVDGWISIYLWRQCVVVCLYIPSSSLRGSELLTVIPTYYYRSSNLFSSSTNNSYHSSVYFLWVSGVDEWILCKLGLLKTSLGSDKGLINNICSVIVKCQALNPDNPGCESLVFNLIGVWFEKVAQPLKIVSPNKEQM